MRPQTIRRLLVFAVCCAGVAALYLLPGTAESPDQVATEPGTQPEPSTRTVTQQPESSPKPSDSASPSATPEPTATVTVTASASADPTKRPKSAEPTRTPDDDEGDPDEEDPPKPKPSPTSTQTDDPEEPEPEEPDEPTSDPPEQVEGLHEVESSYEELTVGWTAAEDDEGIKKYKIYLNGQHAPAQHPDSPTEGTISWWNSEDDVFFVQVAAVDTDDQEGERSERVTVERPDEPSPSPDPPEFHDPHPETPSPSPTSEPS